jgi:hypothetical protein
MRNFILDDPAGHAFIAVDQGLDTAVDGGLHQRAHFEQGLVQFFEFDGKMAHFLYLRAQRSEARLPTVTIHVRASRCALHFFIAHNAAISRSPTVTSTCVSRAVRSISLSRTTRRDPIAYILIHVRASRCALHFLFAHNAASPDCLYLIHVRASRCALHFLLTRTGP